MLVECWTHHQVLLVLNSLTKNDKILWWSNKSTCKGWGVGGGDFSRNEMNVIASRLQIMTSMKPSRGRGVTKDKASNTSLRRGWECSHQKEEIMTGMMTESQRGGVRERRGWERGGGGEAVGLMDPNRRLEVVYMFMFGVSHSRSLCALTRSRQRAFIRASWGSPWEHTVCQHWETPHCQDRSALPKAQEESNSHTSGASPNGPGSGWTAGGSALSKKGETITKMPSLRWTTCGLITKNGGLSLFMHHLTLRRCFEGGGECCTAHQVLIEFFILSLLWKCWKLLQSVLVSSWRTQRVTHWEMITHSVWSIISWAHIPFPIFIETCLSDPITQWKFRM